ncbi:YfiR family protein [Hahella aquimaris]|uniref:YfiR family protein n=1 Tax=Hahella sp. HNIBRBA332 TaxID=3015983 RepID=UPI00273B0922|nr:YfiR family protein [Hahella sp. HNIBRBA332]WLQ17131.1 YfiR family protein [Hahella sp. HNIBRBA332]
MSSRQMCWNWASGMATAIILAFSAAVFAADVEYQIKASYLYNFMQFVSFPQESLVHDGQIKVCIVGVNRFGDALDEVNGAKAPQGTVVVSSLGRYRPNLPIYGCNVLFLSSSEERETERILKLVDVREVLTISEYSPFIAYGGLIELYQKDDSIRFRVNASLVTETNFKVAAQLVQLGVE